MKYFRKGFTMIELLIVIAVLGVLAVAVLSAINPLEQINRGQDTGSRSDTEQALSAIDRYYTMQTLWPWQTTQQSEDAVLWQELDGLIDGSTNVLDKLAAAGAGELKSSFVTRLKGTSYNDLYVEYGAAAGQSVYICFKPKSAAFSTEAVTRCASAPSDYPVNACGGSDCGGAGKACICLP